MVESVGLGSRLPGFKLQLFPDNLFTALCLSFCIYKVGGNNSLIEMIRCSQIQSTPNPGRVPSSQPSRASGGTLARSSSFFFFF